jgi:hypothetical protein
MSYFTYCTSQTKTKIYTVQNNSPLFMQKETTVSKPKMVAAQHYWGKQDKMLQK